MQRKWATLFIMLKMQNLFYQCVWCNENSEVFLINSKGIAVYKGAIDDNPSDAVNVKREHLKLAITEMASGKEITVKESRSVGCTIKRVN
jgi:hypothetical protein